MQSIHLGNFYLRNSKPDDIALIHDQTTITYGELDEKINHYASYLLDLGVKPGDRVALSCYNSPEYIYSYFAVTKIGAIIIPLNLMLMQDELQFIISNANAKILLIHQKIVQKLRMDESQWKSGLGLQEILVLDDATIQAIQTHPIRELPIVDPSLLFLPTCILLAPPENQKGLC